VATNRGQFTDNYYVWLNKVLQVMTIVKAAKLVQASLTKTCNVTNQSLTAEETD
jgi:hypothetical protein